MTLTLTENAAKHIKQQISKRGHGIALRIGLQKSGCSGYSYTYDVADEIKEDDRLFPSEGTNIVVNTSDLPFLSGSQIDFVQEGLNSFYKLNNPNIDNTCGCGESFSLNESAKI
ncbi:MAG: iron-sulfur cluster assembly accessory protein [Burkholderiales bacterium]|uniref:HesB/IscA family protein n=1 Tax=Nitrosomonas sp. TaxID=42353 RepID=UPI001E014998|nr:iron-sulfur cluster assembly accessory protein [Nitrosomonas sp.]MCB1949294.1 iron-sulfur cluster assembly accessory protein [Nitrosomonas sp.]MCP5242305.1 iron-sulfur cluster assembly accessory protein [Burkholderiales bacterium]